jgi:hypothetical protein
MKLVVVAETSKMLEGFVMATWLTYLMATARLFVPFDAIIFVNERV